MRSLFWYRRQVKTKDEEGKDIHVLVWDCMNIKCIIRGHWVNEKTFSVLLNDGHEQADDVEKAVVKNGKTVGTETKRERAWFVSQIEICYEDALRLAYIAGVTDQEGKITDSQLLITQIEDFNTEPINDSNG